ncbi:hypothetical protein B0I26_11525 [Anoxybacillus vitaminiphilus]|uniref:ParB-like nuclease family protein n=1 Tax=Paranoxybacillus vitaminiphilus TaxID=581036 RepID=A0A327YEG3_9BACL|nr:ParB N-terminal domain-containing protein [Anoxybacillus vitaminiphilus]RAK16889.1 hypothetical protein B0I26_11525 [Anoxybacillus vitaminiphilus]
MNALQVSLDQLLLDPNNYRLHGHPRYRYVEENNFSNPLVQKRTQSMIEGENRLEIRDLLESFKANGYLKIDNILVKKYMDTNYFVVIEGNRRVATLKALKKDWEEGFSIGNLNESIFSSLEVVLYEASEEELLLLMGLRHVSGVKKWSEYEQSELVTDLYRKYGMSIKEIAERLGIKPAEVKRRLNAYIIMEKYKNDEEFGYYFNEEMSGIFYEIMGRKDLRDWLGWDQELNDFKNKKNLNRLFSWLSPMDDGETERPPIIPKRDDIRDLNKIIHDEQALAIMEEKRSLAEAVEQSNYYTKEGFKKNLKSIKSSLEKITMSSLIQMDNETKQEVIEIIEKIDVLTTGMKTLLQVEKRD